MKKIGNFYSKQKIEDIEWCNITDNQSELIPNIPTLVVGTDLARSYCTNFNILDWKSDENTFWTFGKREQRHIFEKRIDDFQKLCMDRQKNSVDYKFFNVLTNNSSEKIIFLNQIRNSKHTICFLNNDMAYFNVDNDKNVIGISLRDIEYNGMDKNRFLSTLKSMNNVFFYTNKYKFPQTIRTFLLNSPYISVKLCE